MSRCTAPRRQGFNDENWCGSGLPARPWCGWLSHDEVRFYMGIAGTYGGMTHEDQTKPVFHHEREQQSIQPCDRRLMIRLGWRRHEEVPVEQLVPVVVVRKPVEILERPDPGWGHVHDSPLLGESSVSRMGRGYLRGRIGTPPRQGGTHHVRAFRSRAERTLGDRAESTRRIEETLPRGAQDECGCRRGSVTVVGAPSPSAPE